MKLRGRSTTPARQRGRTPSFSARGAKQTTHHGTLQRLLDAGCKETIKVCYLIIQIEDLASGFNESSHNRARQVHRKNKGLPAVDAMLRLQIVNEAFKRNRARPIVVGAIWRANPECDGELTTAWMAGPEFASGNVVWHDASSIKASNGEVEGPHRSAGQATRAHTARRRPRSQTDHASRHLPTIARRQHSKRDMSLECPIRVEINGQLQLSDGLEHGLDFGTRSGVPIDGGKADLARVERSHCLRELFGGYGVAIHRNETRCIQIDSHSSVWTSSVNVGPFGESDRRRQAERGQWAAAPQSSHRAKSRDGRHAAF